VSEWKEIIKNFVAIDGHYNKVLLKGFVERRAALKTAESVTFSNK
jgi:hypothetical protein